MKAVSLWQPFATLIAIGAKTIETRPATAAWAKRFKGPLVICATATWNREVLKCLMTANRCNECGWPRNDWNIILDALIDAGYKTLGELPLGAAVCISHVTGSIPTESVSEVPASERAFGNFDSGRFAMFTDPSKLFRIDPPIPVKGKQGLWDFDTKLLPLSLMEPPWR